MSQSNDATTIRLLEWCDHELKKYFFFKLSSLEETRSQRVFNDHKNEKYSIKSQNLVAPVVADATNGFPTPFDVKMLSRLRDSNVTPPNIFCRRSLRLRAGFQAIGFAPEPSRQRRSNSRTPANPPRFNYQKSPRMRHTFSVSISQPSTCFPHSCTYTQGAQYCPEALIAVGELHTLWTIQYPRIHRGNHPRWSPFSMELKRPSLTGR